MAVFLLAILQMGTNWWIFVHVQLILLWPRDVAMCIIYLRLELIFDC